MFGEGGCACGALRYRLKAKPMFVNACHCGNCRRLTGGAFAMNAIIEKDQFELISGTAASFALTGGSGKPHEVYFCANCGTYLWNEYRNFPGETWFVRIGTLDDPDSLAPDAHIFTRWKHHAVPIPGDVPVFEERYDRNRVWPEESLARLQATIRAG